MEYKEITYGIEEQFLSEYATKSRETKGRAREIEPCPFRTDFVRDRDRIIHSKAFRRLKHKTQVFLSPEGDHYRTRLTHTLEVMQVARIIARSLSLNEDLTEAIALGHDLGHTPFGHAGENALNTLYPFKHNEQSLRIVDVLEDMNLTYEVRDGVLNHTSSGNPATLEAKVVSWADRIAYISHDIDDSIRAQVLSGEQIPKIFRDYFGNKHGTRINTMVRNLIENSYGKNTITFSNECLLLVNGLRQFLFDTVYTNSTAKAEEHKTFSLIFALYNYYKEDLNRLPKHYRESNCADEQKICDYIATMTDRYAVMTFEELFVPKGWRVM